MMSNGAISRPWIEVLPEWPAAHVDRLVRAPPATLRFTQPRPRLTLALELADLIFAIFLPRRARIVLFFGITTWQIGIILTSNYAFLNYLVLILGFLVLDDQFLARFLPLKTAQRRAV